MQDGSLIPRFGRARRDPGLAVLEGFHPLKHALRFGAHVQEIVTSEPAELLRLCDRLAPDIGGQVRDGARAIDAGVFARLAPLVPNTPVMALAERPASDLATILGDRRGAPLILLEDPRDLGNMGACIRVAAAGAAAGVLSTGSHDPWHPDAIRGAAGLHFALPVAQVDGLEELVAGDRPLLALDPEGAPLDPCRLDPHAILAFGTERYGLSDELTARADALISIPMRAGVSSLNLATSVAAVLFAWRLSGETSAPQRAASTPSSSSQLP